MKILITCDPEIPVPPKHYGGVERLVDGLIRAYRECGHEVVLLAHRDSTAAFANKIYGWPAFSSRGLKNILLNAFKLLTVYHKEKPDVIHSFSRLLYIYPTLFTSKVKFLMTYGRHISPYSTGLASILAGRRIHFTSAAAHMLNHLKRFRHKFTPVYNFVDTNYFVPEPKAEREHLIFLGRIEHIKGTREAIEVAKASGEKLIIAGNIQPGHDYYFNTFIKPHIDNRQIIYVGPVDDEQKRYWLQRAKALLFPINWEEPFGIVMIEAMACGTPVIGFRRGSVPEVVAEGTGFVVDNVKQMVDAVNHLHTLDNQFIRNYCVQKFELMVIAQQYLDLLGQLKLLR